MNKIAAILAVMGILCMLGIDPGERWFRGAVLVVLGVILNKVLESKQDE